MQPVSSWGRLTRAPHDVVALTDRSRAPAVVAASRRPALPFGNGRSYGDVCLNESGVLWTTRDLDRFIAFDPASGRLECEAGVTLDEVIALALPHGWFLPVTPGTRYITLGGAIANDVHGKNHHGAGTFGEHVEALTLLRTDGSTIVCGPDREAGWFRATVGGLGLTGLIATVTLRLRPVDGAWIDATTTPFDSLGAFYALSATASAAHEYTVAWLDCGPGSAAGATRGLFFAGNHAASTAPLPPARGRALPLTPPLSLVTPLSVRAFNRLYRRAHERAPATSRQDYRRFFYPLDGVRDWNRIYGPRGFFQYQCVVPEAVQQDATRELLAIVGAAGTGSFLAVLKTFGARPPAGLLSFPMAGTTLALDFPNRGAATLALFERLDAAVDAAGGRLYAAKDARMPAALFRRGYPQWPTFEPYRDPGISSQMARRLFGH
jgi:FAD/FMN-containing dehydrogenase